MTNDYSLDADRMDVYESYSPSVYVLTNETSETEGSSLPFGFTRHRDLTSTPIRLPEPWMWWKSQPHRNPTGVFAKAPSHGVEP